MKKEYTVLDNEGNYLAISNEHGYGNHITLQTKEDALREIATFYPNKGYRIKKMKVK